jgi:hypothetical protein
MAKTPHPALSLATQQSTIHTANASYWLFRMHKTYRPGIKHLQLIDCNTEHQSRRILLGNTNSSEHCQTSQHLSRFVRPKLAPMELREVLERLHFLHRETKYLRITISSDRQTTGISYITNEHWPARMDSDASQLATEIITQTAQIRHLISSAKQLGTLQCLYKYDYVRKTFRQPSWFSGQKQIVDRLARKAENVFVNL